MQYVVVHVDRFTGKYLAVGPFETAARASGWALNNLPEPSRLTVRVLPLTAPDPD